MMGRRKWKLYQDALIPRRCEPGERSSDDESMPASDLAPQGLKIKTIEQINAPEDGKPKTELELNEEERRPQTILQSLIQKPATQPKLEYEEPADWKPADKCYFCVDGERVEPAGAEPPQGGATVSTASDKEFWQRGRFRSDSVA